MTTKMNERDPYDLARFVREQTDDYPTALSEVRAGRKWSHWMWYVFPQFQGLGFSPMSQKFAIRSVEEAREYLAHPKLGPNLIEIAEAAINVAGRGATAVFGSPDDMKLRSSATLFAAVSAPGSVFHRLLDAYFDGEPDPRTTELIAASRR